ncbi:MAG TPA: hypothetical protein PLK76_00250 [bacterium]|nr:hypothetical protein [bacterium]
MWELIKQNWTQGFATHFLVAVLFFLAGLWFVEKADDCKDEGSKTLAIFFATLHSICWAAVLVLLIKGITNTVLWPIVVNFVESWF